MTDIEVLEREIACVQRKSKINCSNCGTCDLLMDTEQILKTYRNAINALKALPFATSEAQRFASSVFATDEGGV